MCVEVAVDVGSVVTAVGIEVEVEKDVGSDEPGAVGGSIKSLALPEPILEFQVRKASVYPLSSPKSIGPSVVHFTRRVLLSDSMTACNSMVGCTTSTKSLLTMRSLTVFAGKVCSLNNTCRLQKRRFFLG